MIPPTSAAMPKTAGKPRAYSYVRFSRPEQMRGDSLRRQTEMSERYARENGLVLDTSLAPDKGVSAFRGKNATEGALAVFLRMTEDGRIPRGSYLLVESLDRLSRQEVLTALQRFLSILEKGIRIVTLQDQQVYSTESLNGNFAGLLISLTIMSRAHEESATKSKRLSAAWANKRANLANRKLTSLCPGWLRLNAARTAYEEIPERVAVVRRIFADTVAGKGRQLIVGALNSQGVPTWGIGRKQARGWHSSYVTKILNNRAVLGEYQPHRMIDGKRVPEGEPVADYFPRVIDEKTFYLAQTSTTNRRTNRGRVSVTGANLFSRMSVCGQCGGSVVYEDKGKPEWRYLTCYSASRKITNCTPCRRTYLPVESQFLKWCVDFDFSGGQSELRRQKQDELTVALAKIAEAKKRADNLGEAIAQGGKVTTLVPLLEKAEAEIETLAGRKSELEAEIERAEDTAGKNAPDLATLMKDPANRLRLREEIGRRVKKLVFHFGGWRGKPEDAYLEEEAVTVELQDGRAVVLYGADRVDWLQDGKRYEYEAGRVLEPDERPEEPAKRRRK